MPTEQAETAAAARRTTHLILATKEQNSSINNSRHNPRPQWDLTCTPNILRTVDVPLFYHWDFACRIHLL